MERYFNITKAVSPSTFGGEAKNQDRIHFDPQTYTAAVCDGTTSSPFSEKAASMVSRESPLIINSSNLDKSLLTISDLLMEQRNFAIKKGVKVSDDIAESMRTLVEEAANEKLKQSFQTTVVCAGFECQRRKVLAKVLCCGDSGFFVFSSDGQLLLSNLIKNDKKSESLDSKKNKILFYPGSELLCNIVGPLSAFPIEAKQTGISNPDKWVLCNALCLCENNEPLPDVKQKTGFLLDQNELLVAPKYLFSMPKYPSYKRFRRLYYSRFIRRLSSPLEASPDVNFDMRGNITTVLPDHFYTGQWDYFEERFLTDTHFVLCSDGFYRNFSNPAEMWEWLNSNNKNLAIHRKKKSLLNDLHRKLNDKCGDDDISFIWIHPKNCRRLSDAI